jgi:hypothetical protein
MTFTERDLSFLRTLVLRVRLVSEDQALDAWWPATDSGRKNGQRRLRAYCRAGVCERHIVHAKPVRGVELLWSGTPGDAEPDCRQLSQACQSAWHRLTVQRLVVYTATRGARQLFGGTERHRVHALPHLSHDLGTAATYFELLKTAPERAALWRSEDDGLLPAGFGDAQPDAVLVDVQGRPDVAVEFAADYGHRRFEGLVRTCSEQQLGLRIYGVRS